MKVYNILVEVCNVTGDEMLKGWLWKRSGSAIYT